MTRAGDVIAERFVLGRIAGEGAMGVVFHATDTSDDSSVALKLLKHDGEGAAKRFMREAAILDHLEHEHIVRHVAHGVHEERPYIAMQWLRGLTLRDRLLRGPLTVEESLVLAQRIASGLGHAHAAGVVHRDLKPSNVWLEDARIDRPSASPFGVIADGLRRAARIRDGSSAAEERAQLDAWTAACGIEEPEVVAFLGELAGVVPETDDDPEIRAARANATLMSDRLTHAFCAFARVVTQTRPLLILVEDAHWADVATLQLLDALLLNLPDAPVLVIAIGRPALERAHPQLWANRNREVMRLSRLDATAARELVRAVLRRCDDEVAARIIDRSEGNAFYLEELIRATAEGATDRLPTSVAAMVQGRLQALEPMARRVLRAASVFGRRFWAGAVAALLDGVGDEQVASCLAALRAEELVRSSPESRFAEDEEWVFRHDNVLDAAYAMLTEQDRRVGHRLAADWLASHRERQPVALAEHYFRGGVLDRAAEEYLEAAQIAYRHCDFEGAVDLAERGLGLVDGADAFAPIAAELRHHAAKAHRRAGNYFEARRLAESARSFYDSVGDLREASRCQILMGATFGDLGKSRRGIELIEAALERLAELGDAEGLCDGSAFAASQEYVLGRLDVARAHARQSRFYAVELGDVLRQFQGSLLETMTWMNGGYLELARITLDRAAETIDVLSYPFAHVQLQITAGQLARRCGRLEEAHGTAVDVIQAGRRLRAPKLVTAGLPMTSNGRSASRAPSKS